MNKKVIPTAVTAVFLAVEGLIYCGFLVLDLTGRGGQTITLKYTGILLCLLYALLCALRGGDRLVFPALLLTAGADWFLLVRGEHLTVGLILFLAVQTLYLLRLRRLGAGSHFFLRAVSALLLGAAVFLLRMASTLNLLAALYFSQLLSNTILAWERRGHLFAIGLTLFVCCDICVGLFNLGLLLPLAQVGMWLFYLPSQVLIVCSAKETAYENK